MQPTEPLLYGNFIIKELELLINYWTSYGTDEPIVAELITDILSQTIKDIEIVTIAQQGFE